MVEVREDAAARLWWGVRRYAWLVVLVLTTFAVLAAYASTDLAGGAGRFRATSLVVATDLQIRAEQLPRFAATLFASGTVARETAARTGVDVAPDDLIPGSLTVEPVESTILVRVVGTDRDPAVAARLANTAATVLVEQLNAPGPGVGTFAVQERAVVPTSAEEATSPAFAITLGLVAGVAFAAGGVGLILVLRRPVLSAGEAANVAGAPLLGALPLPRRREAAPREVPGVAALVGRLHPGRRETVVLVSGRRDRAHRARLARLVARALARAGPVRYVAVEDDEPLPEGMPSEERANLVVATLDDLKRPETDVPAVIDGPSVEAWDVPQFLPGDARVVLVAREGTPEPALAAAARQFLPGELTGVVFLPRGRRDLRGRRARRRLQGRRAVSGDGRADAREPAVPPGSSPGRRASHEGAPRGEDPAGAQPQVGASGLDA